MGANGNSATTSCPAAMVAGRNRLSHLRFRFVYYCLGQISVLVAFAAVWALMLRIATPAAAFAAILIIDGLHYFNFTAPKFNHDVIQLPFWALAGFRSMARCEPDGSAIGRCLGRRSALPSGRSISSSFSALPLVLFMLIDRRARALPRHAGTLCGRRDRPSIIAPHLVWLLDNNFLPLNYVEAGRQAMNGFFDHFTRPALFAFAQLFWLLPAIIISLPLLQRPREPDATAANDYDRRILALLTFGPAVTVIAASAISGRGLVTMWGYPLWLFLGPWIVVTVGSRVTADASRVSAAYGAW